MLIFHEKKKHFILGGFMNKHKTCELSMTQFSDPSPIFFNCVFQCIPSILFSVSFEEQRIVSILDPENTATASGRDQENTQTKCVTNQRVNAFHRKPANVEHCLNFLQTFLP